MRTFFFKWRWHTYPILSCPMGGYVIIRPSKLSIQYRFLIEMSILICNLKCWHVTSARGKLYSATPRAFMTYCLFIPRLLMTWQQNICSRGVNLVPLEFRSKHHKASRLKLKSWLTPEHLMCWDFFADKVLYMGVFVVLLAAAVVLNVTANRCIWYRLTMPYEGMYCIFEGTVFQKLLPHECQSMCLQSATCKAYNYNVTEGTCTQFSSPCPQAFSDSVMEFVVFRNTPVSRCYEWVPYSPGDPLDERMVATDNPWFIVARLQVNNNDGVDHCFGGLG